MRLRALSTVLVAAVAVAGLSGCQTKVGQAAVVGGHRISDSTVASYVTRSGPSAQILAAAAQQGQQVQPRLQALSSLIQEQVYLHALKATGGVPAQSELAGLHDEAAQRLLGASATGEAFDAQLAKQVSAYGFSDKFLDLILRVAELEDALINRTKAASLAELVAAIGKHPVSVSVSGRYGTWSSSQLTLDTQNGAGQPDFVTFGPGATGVQGATSTGNPTG